MAKKATQSHRFVAVQTALGQDSLLFLRMSGQEALGRPFEYHLELGSSNHDVDFNALLGTNLTVRVDLPGNKSRFFNGCVNQFAFTGFTRDGLARYQATVVPWLWFLTRHSDCRIFQRQTVPEIIQSVFREAGFSDFENRLKATYKPRDFCVQYRETSFDFVSRLMEFEGIYYFFSHKNGKHTLVLCDEPSAHQDTEHASSFPYRSHDSAIQGDYFVYSWSRRKQVRSGSYALNDFSFKSPKPSPTSKLLARKNQPLNHALDSGKLYDAPGWYVETSDGERYAKLRLEEAQADHELAHGQTNARTLAPGYLFELRECPKKDQNGKFLVTQATYQIRGDEYSTGSMNAEDLFSCTFTAVPKGRVFRTPRITRVPVVEGPQTAMVVGPSGEEIYTDKYGRVKLQFFWDRYGKADAGSSCWVRVAQVWAGKGWGALCIPRIGQEVVVEFIEGNPDLPIVTGRVYNADSMPPYGLPGEKTKMSIKTSTTKGGGGFNEIRFDDQKGKEQFFIHAERDREVRVKKDNIEWIGEEEHIVVGKDRFEEVKGDAHLKVSGVRNQEIGESESLKVGQNLQQKAGMRIATQAGTEIHLKAGMNIVIEAGMSITLKAGGGFITVGPTGVAISGTPVLINSGGAAGSGSGSSPAAPKKPKEAAKAKGGEVDKAISGGRQPDTCTAPSPTAVTLRQAAESGTPFCEVCQN